MLSKANPFKVFIAACALVVATPFLARATVFKIGTLSPEGSVWMEIMREGAESIEKKTEGRVKFKFYPGGVMGSDQAVLRKIRIGQLHGGAVVAGSLSHIFPDICVYALPFTFDSLAEVDYVRQRMDSELTKGLEKHGFVGFGPAEGGFVYLMSKSPVRTVSDLSGLKVWVPENDEISLEAIKSFGVSPIALSLGEVRTGLQTGLIDTIGTSPIGAIALQWHTQLKYLMDVPLLYVYALMVLDKKDFDKLSPPDRQIVRETMDATFDKLDKINRKDNIEALRALKNQGIDFVELSEDSVAIWKKGVANIPEQLIEKGRLSKDIFDSLTYHLKDYRSSHASRDE